MAMSNKARVTEAFDLLAQGLGPYVDRVMRAHLRLGEDWPQQVARRSPQGYTEQVSLEDPAFLLRVMADNWDAFKGLTKRDRNTVFELREVRNGWAHNRKLDTDDAFVALHAIERLLTAIDAVEADEVSRHKDELLRTGANERARKAASKAADPSGDGAVAGLPAWRDVVVPHDDVTALRRLSLAEFAADLYQVRAGHGRPEYIDPVEFFRRTYLTVGLRELLTQSLERLSHLDEPVGVPIVDLQTTFGGGKTHSMIALYHLAGLRDPDALPQEAQEAWADAGVSELPEVRRVVIVGTQLAAGQSVTKPDGTEIRTLWGELAWQLGGREAFALVAEADRTGTNPGESLRTLLAAHSPCLILIDEWVAYARDLLGRDDLPGGTFDTHFTFAQALTEAVRVTPGALLVVSLPASQRGTADQDTEDPDQDLVGSEREVGGSAGREALRRLRNVVGRMESSWRPATSEESFAIVQRRLFQPIEPGRLAQRDATARAFADLYRRSSREFPSDCSKDDYEARIRAAYPIHPELFHVLYEDWSTLDRFQRTRGVLRLMATVIHVLWHAGDQSPLVLPGSLPLDDAGVVGELNRHLEESWKPIVDADVDGPASVARAIDAEVSNLGQYAAARRVARTIFFGSAPRAGRARGIEAARVRLGCAMPGQTVSVYNDALSRLVDRATYLYTADGASWFGTQPGVTRMARDRAERLLEREHHLVDTAILEKLRAATADRGHFAEVHVGVDSPDHVPDTAEVRLVVLPPDHTHVQRSTSSGAMAVAKALLQSDGSGPRDHPNMLAFLAADQATIADLQRAVADELAWTWIAAHATEMNIAPQQAAQAAARAKETRNAADLRLAATYKWLLVPVQPDPLGPIDLEVHKVDGASGLAVRAGAKMLAESRLYTVYAPALLRGLLNGVLAPEWEGGHVSIARLWELIASYVYLPRLASVKVLEDAARIAPHTTTWAIDSFTCADGFDTVTGRYLGLATGGEFQTATQTTLIVRPDIASAQLARERAADATDSVWAISDALRPAEPGSDREAVVITTTIVPTSFGGSVLLGNGSLLRDFRGVVDEVVAHLLAEYGAKVEVRLEITAHRDEGFSDEVRRVVTENSKQLRFDPGSGFS